SASVLRGNVSLVKQLTTLSGTDHLLYYSDLIDPNFDIVRWLHLKKSERYDELLFERR
ncbi:hypothetical protein M404DRAFT_49234, partial [Pisolithus tinctorius Marx 270]